MSTISLTIHKTNTETILKFSSETILTSGSYQFNNIDEAKESPLAQQLFHLPFIKRVFISANFIALEKFSIVEWADVQNEVKEQMENYLNSGNELISTNEVPKKTPIEIYAEGTPNPSVLKFVSNKKLVENDYEFKKVEDTNYSLLAKELFNFPFVKEVFFSENYVSITKSENPEWSEITNDIRSFIKEFIASGKNIVEANAISTQVASPVNTQTSSEDLDDVSKQIISILDEYIRPAVAADGGNIMFDSYDQDSKTVNVILQGACSGCPSSTVTLKNGIENMLKQLIPGQIEEVVAVNY